MYSVWTEGNTYDEPAVNIHRRPQFGRRILFASRRVSRLFDPHILRVVTVRPRALILFFVGMRKKLEVNKVVPLHRSTLSLREEANR